MKNTHTLYDSDAALYGVVDLLPCLERYLAQGIMPGGFLTAVLCNDLREACGRADSNNIRRIPEIVGYLWNYFPSNAWGSAEQVRKYVTSIST